MFLGAYPITPASDILHELSKHKRFNVTTMQAEDEIAAVGAALGASYGGALGITTTSGPGVALKGETISLAIALELPLVIVDVQRVGPSTGYLAILTPQERLQFPYNFMMLVISPKGWQQFAKDTTDGDLSTRRDES